MIKIRWKKREPLIHKGMIYMRNPGDEDHVERRQVASQLASGFCEEIVETAIVLDVGSVVDESR